MKEYLFYFRDVLNIISEGCRKKQTKAGIIIKQYIDIPRKSSIQFKNSCMGLINDS